MAGEDPDYLAWIRLQACQFCDRPPPSHAHHHTGPRGKGQRAHDHNAMALCFDCHRHLHGASGPFKDWNHEERSNLQDELVVKHRQIYNDEECF
jgi:hypothetical protein